MKLVGKRIVIRDLKLSDDEDLFEYGSHPEVGYSAGWKPYPSITVARRVLSSFILSKETFGIEELATSKLIGTISLYHQCIRPYNKIRSLGFSLHPDYWNQGIMTEAVLLMLDYAFTKENCELVEVGHHSDNYGSKRVIEKCGFQYDGRLAKFKQLYDGRVIDADFYSMTKEEYERRKQNEESFGSKI